MEAKTIKISENNYRELCEYAGGLQKDLGEPVSIDRALMFILRRAKLSDLAGSWKMSDEQAEDMMNNLRKGWHKWKIASV